MANGSGAGFWLVCASLLFGAACGDDGPSSEICGNGLDDDGNGATDCADKACASQPACLPPVEACDNHVDDDGNGATDCEDSACTTDPACLSGAEICNNGVDDDGNGASDCEDAACSTFPACVPPVEICDNHIDDDGNGATDCEDAACASEPGCLAPEEVCDNHVDDDGDGAIDCDDTECVTEPVCGVPGEEICDNGVDDDGDGAIDCDDTRCASEPVCGPTPTEVCDNGLDDDGDGLVDCLDTGCAGLDPCIQLASPGDVVIVEIMIDPMSVADSAGEWIELYNTTNVDIDIAGWVLHDIDANAPQWHVIGGQGPVVIAAGSTLVLGALADPAGNGGVSVDYRWATFDLANDADEIVLEVKGELIDVVTYAVPAWAVTGGHSLSLDPASQTASANDDPSTWCLGVTAYNAMDRGTPGTTNPSCP